MANDTLKILSVSCVFPNSIQPGLGPFVRSRLQQVATRAELKVVAPVGVVDYSASRATWGRLCTVPERGWDGPVEVFHPRWFYVPGGTWLNPFCLAAQLVGRLARLRKSFPFQIIDAHFGFPDGIAAACLSKALGVPFSVTLRGNETMHARAALTRSLMRWTLRRASCVIAVSGRLRDFAIALGASPDCVKTIPNGIDTALYFPRDRAECRRKHGILPDERLILSVGALIERKGHHRAARALRALLDRGIRASLLIVGGPGPEGRFEDKIREVVAELDLSRDVIFFGHANAQTTAELMSAANVLCLASTREGCPNVVNEALACGTPVVATDVGGVPDMLSSDQLGYVVPADDQSRLEEALGCALRRTWDRQGIAASGQSRSWAAVAREVLTEFEKVVRL